MINEDPEERFDRCKNMTFRDWYIVGMFVNVVNAITIICFAVASVPRVWYWLVYVVWLAAITVCIIKLIKNP